VSGPRVSPRWSRRLTWDVALAALLLALGLAEVWAALPSRQGSGDPGWTTLSVVAGTLPLVVRRTHPAVMVALAFGSMCLLYGFTPVFILFYGQFVPAAVVMFSVARHGRGREPVLGALAGAVVVTVLAVSVPEQRTPESVVFNVVGLALAWLAGWGLTLFERRAAASRQQAIDAQVTAARLAMSAVIEERTRIARELHDIVAHAVSVIVVQAGAAEPIVEDDPAFVRAALATIRTTGAGALGEMRRVVAMLRDDGDPQLLAPQPGVASLPELLEQARQGGLDASLIITGDAAPLPSGVDLAAYRIVQEALSNTRRHARASHARVHLTYQPDCLSIEVQDNGAGSHPGSGTGGHGLIGMRERAALYGGTIEATNVSGADGFTVRATLLLGTL
jgi:signal transduction histidine kinase